MKDTGKTKAHLIEEVEALRERVATLERKSESEARRATATPKLRTRTSPHAALSYSGATVWQRERRTNGGTKWRIFTLIDNNARYFGSQICGGRLKFET